MGIADRFLYLRDGRIAAEYTPEDLLLLPEADILGMGLRSPHEGKSLPAPSVLDESPAVLKTAGLSKRIRKEVIFEDISLSVPEGSVTAITGQNGAGKTTLAQILCGLARQTRGHILIDGEKARAAVRRREIYYCGNDTSTQFFTASVAEELLLNTELTEENKDRARHLLKEFGLYEYRDTHPSTLSGGQKQRLAIACAIFSGRRILILDEPTTGLDPQTRLLIWNVIERLRTEENMTVFLTTHYMEEAASAGYVVIIDKGSIVAEGTPLELKNEYVHDTISLYGVTEDEIKALETEYKAIRDGYRIQVKNTLEATKMIVKHQEIFRDYEVVKGGMDDVFLAVTGKILGGGQ